MKYSKDDFEMGEYYLIQLNTYHLIGKISTEGLSGDEPHKLWVDPWISYNSTSCWKHKYKAWMNLEYVLSKEKITKEHGLRLIKFIKNLKRRS